MISTQQESSPLIPFEFTGHHRLPLYKRHPIYLGPLDRRSINTFLMIRRKFNVTSRGEIKTGNYQWALKRDKAVRTMKLKWLEWIREIVKFNLTIFSIYGALFGIALTVGVVLDNIGNKTPNKVLYDGEFMVSVFVLFALLPAIVSLAPCLIILVKRTDLHLFSFPLDSGKWLTVAVAPDQEKEVRQKLIASGLTLEIPDGS